MSQANISLRSFNGGQVGPRTEGRTDIEQYGTSSRLIKNLIPKVNGSLVRRPGTRYSAAALESNGTAKPSRLISFQIGDDENYMLELNEYRMRVFKDESPMTYQPRVFSKNELGVEGGAYHFDAEFGHGFYHGQPVTFDTSPYVVPNGLSAGAQYYVVLPEAFTPTSSVDNGSNKIRLNYTDGLADLNLGLGQGPYSIQADYREPGSGYGDTPHGGRYYVEQITTHAVPANNFLLMRTGKSATSPQVESGGGAPYASNITVVPLEEAYAKTFQLSNDRTDLRGNVLSHVSPSIAGDMRLTPTSEEVILDTPWSNAEVWELDFSSGIDRMFFYHENYPPMELNRWNVGAFRFIETPIEHTAVGEVAPFGDQNQVTIDTITSAGAVDNRPNSDNVDNRIGETAVVGIGNTHSDLTGTGFNVGHVGQTFRWVNPTDGEEVSGTEKVHLVGKTMRVGAVGVDHEIIDLPLSEAFFDSDDISGATITLDSGAAFAEDDPISFVSGTQSLSGNIVERTVYFVRTVSTNDITVAPTSGGTAITIGSQPGNNHRVVSHVLTRRVGVAFANAGDATGLTGNFLEGASKAVLSVDGELPTGLLSGTPYRIKALAALGQFYLEHWGGSKDGTIPYLSSLGSGRLYINASGNSNVAAAQVRANVAAGQQIAGSDKNRVNFVGKTKNFHTGEWGAINGWPRSGTQYEQRHVVAGSVSQPNRVWASETGNDVSWSPFSPIYSRDSGTAKAPANTNGALIWETLDTSGFSFDPLSSSTSNIQWCHGHNILLVATKSEIFEIAASSNREALTPANVNSRIVSTVGSNRIKPVRAGSDVIYVSASSSEISALLFDGVSAASTPQSLTVWSEDVMDSEIRQLAWQNEPIPILWLCREDGVLYGCTYDRDQSVVGWHQHELGGSFDSGIPKVRSVATVRYDATNERDSYDRLWMSVSRTVATAEVQYIEWMTPGLMDWEESTSAVYLDCCPAPKSGLNTTDPYGVGEALHLKSETVGQWVKSHSSLTSLHARYLGTAVIAVNGSLPTIGTVSHCTIGYTYNSEYSSLPLESVADVATSEATIQGFRKRIVDAWVRLHRSHDGAISSQLSSDQSQRTPLGNEDLGTITTGPFTGVVTLRGFQHEWNEEATFNLLVEPAVPFELLSVVCRVDWSER
tara:strand:- start:10208 stop:13672 length:3465 start_codon:yes stop_codon:yes gene_type:complete